YPSKSPGGWHLLGLCPVPLYRPEDNVSVLINAGDTVSFEAVSREAFIEIASQHNFEWDVHA
ncbi:MAG: carboxyltransferase domain-containing protein, partial [Pseudomonadota bacterium]|nr:carboxyltransferase domain-containing protein [Pseudomonadota bacterium]